MEFLRGRCTSPPPKHGRDEGLPLVHPKGRRLYSGGRSGRHGGGHGGGSGRHQHHPGASLRRHSMRLLLAAMAIVVAVRVSTHLLSAPEPQLEDLMRLYGDGPAAGSEAGGRSAAAAADAATPKLIPRIIHQTHPGGAAPTALLPLMASWRRLNPGWEVRLYDDQVRALTVPPLCFCC